MPAAGGAAGGTHVDDVVGVCDDVEVAFDDDDDDGGAVFVEAFDDREQGADVVGQAEPRLRDGSGLVKTVDDRSLDTRVTVQATCVLRRYSLLTASVIVGGLSGTLTDLGTGGVPQLRGEPQVTFANDRRHPALIG
ncbi:hypothetical protein ACIBCN_16875 [Nocardia sp. NPDC051052]|uniref:hypothetical protein n=1 Tax=Nocardia sp. NPDC051052 TaxID=3364322 RepID=UPI0037876F35